MITQRTVDVARDFWRVYGSARDRYGVGPHEHPSKAQLAERAAALGIPWPPCVPHPGPQPAIKGVPEVPQVPAALPHAKYSPPPIKEGTVTITLTETQARQLLAVCAYNTSVAREVAKQAEGCTWPAAAVTRHYGSGLLATNLGLVHSALKAALP